jgi:predicted nuclease of predicted toxin-antitoxin system
VTKLDLVCDENIALSTVNALRALGYSVAAAIEDLQGAPDVAVLHKACTINAVLLTFDRDFGELIFKRGLPAPQSVLYLRSIPASSAEMTSVFEELLGGRLAGEIVGYFVVWTRDGIRKRAFPQRN